MTRLHDKQEIRDITGQTITAINAFLKTRNVQLIDGKVTDDVYQAIVREYREYISITELAVKLQQTATNTNFIADNSDHKQNLVKRIQQMGIDVVSHDGVKIIYRNKNIKLVPKSDLTTSNMRYLQLWVNGYGKNSEEKAEVLMDFVEETCPVLIGELRKQNLSPYYKGVIAEISETENMSDLPEWNNREISVIGDRTKRYPAYCHEEYTTFQSNLKSAGYLPEDAIIRVLTRETHSMAEIIYSVEDFALMMQYALQPEAIERNNLVQKAVDNPRYAQLWLFVAVHFVSMWRKNDYTRLPNINISGTITKSEIMEQVNAGNYASFEPYATLLESAIKMKGMKPNKTNGISGVPALRFHIPTQARPVIGLIIAIAAFHAKGETLITNTTYACTAYEAFFGKEFSNLLQYSPFSSRAANKAFAQTIEIQATNETHEVAAGYVMVALLRSHKIDYNKIPQSTAAYLDNVHTDGYSPEYVVSQLFARGICSFAVDHLMEVLYGAQYAQLSMQAQTKLLHDISIDALDAERIVQVSQTTEYKADMILQEIRENPDITMETVLERIAYGRAIGRDDGYYCYSIAINGYCVCRMRGGCLGCKYEILSRTLLSNLLDIRSRIIKQDVHTEKERERNNVVVSQISSEIKEILLANRRYADKETSAELEKLLRRKLNDSGQIK